MLGTGAPAPPPLPPSTCHVSSLPGSHHHPLLSLLTGNTTSMPILSMYQFTSDCQHLVWPEQCANSADQHFAGPWRSAASQPRKPAGALAWLLPWLLPRALLLPLLPRRLLPPLLLSIPAVEPWLLRSGRRSKEPDPHPLLRRLLLLLRCMLLCRRRLLLPPGGRGHAAARAGPATCSHCRCRCLRHGAGQQGRCCTVVLSCLLAGAGVI